MYSQVPSQLPHPTPPAAAAPHVVFAGGGTGGHLFPGLAVAERLREVWPGARVSFASVGKPLERQLVRDAGFAFVEVPSAPFRRGLRGLLLSAWENACGYAQAARFLARESVSLVVGLGGYASVPTALAALRRRVPLVLLEQNAVPGRATRLLARWADTVCLAMPHARASLPRGSRAFITGNPVRPAIATAGGVLGPRRTLLVLGGSGGARALNQHVPAALAAIAPRLAGWRIVHQTGPADGPATRTRYAAAGLAAEVVDFLPDIAAVLARAGLAISRAGGTTLAELAAAGVPALLIPYPHAADDHQRANAEFYAAVGAAELLDQRRLTAPLATAIAARLPAMLKTAEAGREAMLALAHPQAADEVLRRLAHVLACRRGNRPIPLGATGSVS